MVEINLSDDLIDLVVEDVLAVALSFGATGCPASRLSQMGCVRRASANILHRNLFHIVSLLGYNDVACPVLNAGWLVVGATVRQIRTAATQTCVRDLTGQIAGRCVISGWRRSA